MQTITQTQFTRLRMDEMTNPESDGSWTCGTCGRHYSAISDHTHINPEPNGWQNAHSDPYLQRFKIVDG